MGEGKVERRTGVRREDIVREGVCREVVEVGQQVSNCRIIT